MVIATGVALCAHAVSAVAVLRRFRRGPLCVGGEARKCYHRPAVARGRGGRFAGRRQIAV